MSTSSRTRAQRPALAAWLALAGLASALAASPSPVIPAPGEPARKFVKLAAGNASRFRLAPGEYLHSVANFHNLYSQHTSAVKLQGSGASMVVAEHDFGAGRALGQPRPPPPPPPPPLPPAPAPSQSPKRAGLLEKICIGTSNRLSGAHNKTDHYQNLAERYRNCTYVIGNLEITWLNERDSSSARPPSGGKPDLSFLESIREITGYLLIAYVDVDTIRMPNLQIIRGRDLFKFNADDAREQLALVMIENNLRSLELPNLREILAGSIGSYNNKNLCHIRTINWDEIINWPMYGAKFVYNGTQPECPACDASCLGSCWAEGPDMCQKISKTNCSPQCAQGRCFGPSASDCCHAYCAAGCTGPKASDCLACKNFYDDGECIQECPSMMRYNPSKFLSEPNPNGKYAFGGTCVKECPEHLLRDNGACVRTCPPNKRSSGGECVPCGGPCPKNCQGVEVVHSGNIDQLINCTVIEGSITILDTSFAGYNEVHANNNTIGQRYKPMHPSRLEAFKTLREITGYLNIQANHSDFRNLSYFRNLKQIGGRQTTDMFYSLSIIKTSLVSLNLRSLRKVRSGRVLIEDNRDLCFADTIDWLQINLTRREDITTRNNAEAGRCRQLQLQCHQQCAQDGCWGPGPDECLSCNNYKLDDHCVDNCTSLEGSSSGLAYDSGARTCKRCHSECKLGCNGPEAVHCQGCKNVQDGPYCVAECPSHKYNNSRALCVECDKACASGCTGPSARLGEGGCESCAKAVINATEPQLVAHCIRADEPCPDGYYQEYVGPQAAGPLKSVSGRPVCRKCHHRCKSCTGMGTHASVCQCAKYVAGEQCEDFCPRDYYADEQRALCGKCSPECNGCLGPSEADCITCRKYRIYYDTASASRAQVRFNCTAQCPADKPHRISESNMLDPYCSEEAGSDADTQQRFMGSGGPTSVIFMLIISGSLMFCVSIYRCQLEKDKTVKLTMHLSGIDDHEPLTPSNLKPNLAPLRSIKETELRKGIILGSGFGGTVYQGQWFPDKGHGEPPGKPRPVAIKVLRDNGSSNMNKEFLDEAYIMASVSHDNLVRLLAVCMTPNHLMLVTQLMPHGCLLDHVRKHRDRIGPKTLLEWCKQIARGMAYLEQHRMVHRDLALRNVLLQTPGKALISDFGLAKLLELDQSEYLAGGGRLPIKWLAPECFRERKFTHKSDVWAFGVTVWELVTFGERPFEEYDTKDVPGAVEKGARLKQPGYVSTELYKLMLACWLPCPDERPDFVSLERNFVLFASDPERYLACGGGGPQGRHVTAAAAAAAAKSRPGGRRRALSASLAARAVQPSSAKLAALELDTSVAGSDEAEDELEDELAGSQELEDDLADEVDDCDDLDELEDDDEDDEDEDLYDVEHDDDEEALEDEEELVDDDDDQHDQHEHQIHSRLLDGHLGHHAHLHQAGGVHGERHQRHRLAARTARAANQKLAASALPELTPSTHNKLNEQMFGFELARQHSAKAHPLGPATDANNNSLAGHHHHHHAHLAHHLHHHPHHHHGHHERGPQWASAVSSSSLGQKSEQPTDMYDYLLPSPSTELDHNRFGAFYGPASAGASSMPMTPVTPSSVGSSRRLLNPPHSAGLIGVTNEEYFMGQAAASYVNHKVYLDHKRHLRPLDVAAGPAAAAAAAAAAPLQPEMGFAARLRARRLKAARALRKHGRRGRSKSKDSESELVSGSSGNIPHSLV